MSQVFFRWFPVPLWCYAVPMALVSTGLLPEGHPLYKSVSHTLLPVALTLLLIGVDARIMLKSGRQALLALAIGALGITFGCALGVGILREALPPDAWIGAGALTATWTGGSINLLSIRSILDMPDTLFAPLLVVDTLLAYAWMAVLMAASGWQKPINHWLLIGSGFGAPGSGKKPTAPELSGSCLDPRALSLQRAGAFRDSLISVLSATFLVTLIRMIATQLPEMSLIRSERAWTILLVTSTSVALSFNTTVRRLYASSDKIGKLCLYLVLAATGAQAQFQALVQAPIWLVMGLFALGIHAICLLLGGRLLRIPLGLLATASQANIGGFVSAPLVAAVYHPSLVAVALLLATSCSALGTYLGLASASLCRFLF